MDVLGHLVQQARRIQNITVALSDVLARVWREREGDGDIRGYIQ